MPGFEAEDPAESSERRPSPAVSGTSEGQAGSWVSGGGGVPAWATTCPTPHRSGQASAVAPGGRPGSRKVDAQSEAQARTSPRAGIRYSPSRAEGHRLENHPHTCAMKETRANVIGGEGNMGQRDWWKGEHRGNMIGGVETERNVIGEEGTLANLTGGDRRHD